MHHAAGICIMAVHPLLTGLVSYIANTFSSDKLAFRHVKGHHGNAWNELADFAAKALLKGTLEPTKVPHDQIKDLVTATGVHQWGWLLTAPPQRSKISTQ